MHSRIARRADHVFFAVWDKRDLFADHSSAHWAPNFTDLEYFNREHHKAITPEFDFGFFGSKGGLERAEPMKDIANKNNWTYDVRQVGSKGKHQWPSTAEAMSKCKALYNHDQKHDGPNLRVIESMAVGRVLITPNDPRSGMGYLFEPWQDYLPYTPYTCEGLEERMKFAIGRENACTQIAENAYQKVVKNHLTKHRINQILEVVNG
jgi:spore maturation protein CgeB